MDLINFVGLKLGITKLDFYEEMKSLFYSHFNHINIGQAIEPSAWVKELKHDKKMKFGQMNFAIPVSLGNIQIFQMNLDETLINLVGDYIETSKFFNSA